MSTCRLLAVLCSVLLLSACTGDAGTKPAVPVGSAEHTLRVGDLDRTYRTYRPAALPDRAVPLVVVLHGGAGSGRQAERAYGWNAEADRGGFVVAYPDGVRRTWNAGPGCCGAAARDRVDDVGFLRLLVEAVSAAARIDPARVFVTGMSNGAMMAYRLACETTVFAAIGPVAGIAIGECADPAPMSVIHLHGTADESVPYGGGPGKRDNGGTGRLPVHIDGPAVPDLVADWRAAAGCPPPDEHVEGAVTTSVARCPGGRTVELISIEGGGHEWPGGATARIWRFFAGLG